ncbi:MAG: hypothetical protein Ct9H300mP13_2250 [Gammaproteobacteria bacterium]|nr:MAG: hypothetical protein Ct9H300mP13_2250 [Gammaproteobacteria bacterium]
MYLGRLCEWLILRPCLQDQNILTHGSCWTLFLILTWVAVRGCLLQVKCQVPSILLLDVCFIRVARMLTYVVNRSPQLNEHAGLGLPVMLLTKGVCRIPKTE